MNDIGIIHLQNDGFTLVDSDLFEWLNQWQWRVHESNGYIFRFERDVCGKRRRIWMHHVISQTPVGLETDHKNRCRFDNRRDNLRNATHAENCSNRNKRTPAQCSSKFVGVSWHKQSGKWQAQAGRGVNRKTIGRFDSELDAALAYDLAAKVHYGEFARTNILQYG